MDNNPQTNNRLVIIDTYFDHGECDYCDQPIDPEGDQIVIGTLLEDRQWFSFYHPECAKVVETEDNLIN